MTRAQRIGSVLALLLLAAGAVRFVQGGLLPALHTLTGDFGASFPTAYFASLRPDFSTKQVWPGWTYGPMLHFLTLPLFLAPRWSMVPPLWALTNLIAVVASFVWACRLSGAAGQVSWPALASLAGLWLWFKPLHACFEQGNIELVEMAVVLAALVALSRSRGRLPGVLLGVATMIKFAPVGFLGWLVVRRQWHAVKAGVVTIAIIAAIAQVTLGWQNNRLAMFPLWQDGVPQVSADTQSVTSLFLHRAGLLDYSDAFFAQRWFPMSRARTAAQAGTLACALLAAGYLVVLFRRRRHPVSPFEISVLFMAMFLILPLNHQYYYVFALVPLSVLFLRSVAGRQWGVLALTMAAYLMMSPPFRFPGVNLHAWFGVPFFYVISYGNVLVFGALILWAIATHQMLSEPADPAEADRPRRAGRRVLWLALPATALVVAAGWRWMAHARSAPGASISVVTVERPVLLSGPPAIAVSPDGTRVAYVAVGQTLCARDIGSPATTCWPEVAEAAGPFFSPDGRWIAFFSNGALKKVPAAGGAVEAVNGVPSGQTGNWGRDNTIVFTSPYGIVTIAVAGGPPEYPIPPRPEDGTYLTPVITPSGDAVIFTIAPVGGGFGAGTIVAQSLKTGRRTTLFAGSQPHFDETTGRLLYALGGRVLAVPFNPETLEASGVAVPVAGDVLTTVDGGAQFAVGANGTLVYLPRTAEPAVRRTLMWVDRQGAEVALPIPANAFETPRISPDGTRLAVTIRDVLTDVWAYDLATGAATRITSRANWNDTPVWLPDGRTIAFAAVGGLAPRPVVLSTRVDDAGRQPAVLRAGGPKDRPGLVQLNSSSPDGHVLAGTQGGDLWLLDTSAADPRLLVIDTPFTEGTPAVSPDGRWIAFTSNRTSRTEVYVRDFPGLQQLRQVSTHGGTEPVWSRDGHELFYREYAPMGRFQKMMAVTVTTRPAFVAGTPQQLFREALPGTWALPSMADVRSVSGYDVAPDGRHFLFIRADPGSGRNDFRVVERWPAMLPR